MLSESAGLLCSVPVHCVAAWQLLPQRCRCTVQYELRLINVGVKGGQKKKVSIDSGHVNINLSLGQSLPLLYLNADVASSSCRR
jgi:hypothetical protein